MNKGNTYICPNCDTTMESDYCYCCKYTTKGYNYLADEAFLQDLRKKQEDFLKAKSALSKIYPNSTITYDCMYLPVNYCDADKDKIKNTIKRINTRYKTDFDYKIVRKF